MAKGKKTGGRQKGTPNKLTTDVRRAIVEAFDMVGGAEYLKNLATSDPKAFCTLLGKTVPVKMEGDPDNPLMIAVTVDRPPEETREQWLARRAREMGFTQSVGTAAGTPNGRDHG